MTTIFWQSVRWGFVFLVAFVSVSEPVSAEMQRPVVCVANMQDSPGVPETFTSIWHPFGADGDRRFNSEDQAMADAQTEAWGKCWKNPNAAAQESERQANKIACELAESQGCECVFESRTTGDCEVSSITRVANASSPGGYEVCDLERNPRTGAFDRRNCRSADASGLAEDVVRKLNRRGIAGALQVNVKSAYDITDYGCAPETGCFEFELDTDFLPEGSENPRRADEEADELSILF